MRNISVFIRFIVDYLFPLLFRYTILGVIVTHVSAFAQTDFISVHQWEQSGITGWKNLFPPPSSGYSWRAPETQTNLSTFKIFIPKGTTLAYASGYLPQSVKYAVVTRIGQPPVRTSMVSLGEYAQLMGENSNQNTMFAKMLAGQEITTVHDGGGAKSLIGMVRYQQTPFDKSVWVYGRVLQVEGEPPYPIDTLRGQYEFDFDSTMYSNWFRSAVFSSNGDPLENNVAFVGCRGGSVSWGDGCTASVPDTAFGQSVSAKNTAFGLKGSIAGQCTATAGWSNVALDCTPAVFCKGGSIVWGDNNQCAAVIPDTLSGEYVYKANGTSGFAGYVTGQCTGTAWTNIGLACNAIAPTTSPSTGAATSTASTATTGSTASTSTNTNTGATTGSGGSTSNTASPTSTTPTVAATSGDLWGCEVLLCLSNPNGPMAVAECVPPIQRLYAAIFKLRPDPFPTCDMAVSADGSRSYATPIYDYIYDDCPANTTTIPDGYLVMQGTRGNIPSTISDAWIKKGIGDGSAYRKQADSDLRQKVCGGGAYFETSVTTGGGDGMNTSQVGVYEWLTFLDPRKNNFAIKVFINNQLWRVVTP